MFPTDPEFFALSETLEALYKDELQREPGVTHIDPLGRGRWTYDYAQHRQRGSGHEDAIRRVVTEIRRIAGVPNP